MTPIENHDVYTRDDVVDYYRVLEGLTPAETFVFERYIPPGSRVLDLGVGGGRTTAALRVRASRYVGVDYSEKMVAACKAAFPDAELHALDAARLDRFDDGSFDAVVFSYHGLDYLTPEAHRQRCVAECARVLSPGGRFLFSSYNARWIVQRPVLSGAPAIKKAWRVVRAALLTARMTATKVPSRAFWTGTGYIVDPAHGGIVTHVETPSHVRRGAARVGFDVIDQVSTYYPKRTPTFGVASYYYVLEKRR